MKHKTLLSWFRRAVLKYNHNKCAICGRVRGDIDLEAHHIVKVGQRVLSYDYRNGVPVCSFSCHQYAHTGIGHRQILDNHEFTEYLWEKSKWTNVKAYLQHIGKSRAEWEEELADELKTVASRDHWETA